MAVTTIKTVQIRDLAVTNAKLAGSIAYGKLTLTDSIVNADINSAAAIAYSKLNLTGSIVDADVNASAAIAYSKLNLTGSIVDADVNASAAIAYSKLNLTGSIVDADINASAAIALSKLAEAVIQADGGQAFTGDQSMGSNKLTNLAAPTAGTDAANKAYVDGLSNGLSWKQAVRAGSTANGALATDFENGDTMDGVTLATGDRILLKDQTAADENGIYIVAASGAPARSADADTWDELVSAAVFISEGTGNGDTAYVCTSDAGGTLETTAVDFVLFSSASATSAASVTFDPSGIDNTASTNVQAAMGDYDTAMGNRTYTEDNVVTDAQSLTASVDALDVFAGDLTDTTAASEGVTVIGDRAARYSNFTGGATLAVTLTGIDTALGLLESGSTPQIDVETGVTSATQTLSQTPDTGAANFQLFLNGVLLNEGGSNDFTRSGTTVTHNISREAADVAIAMYNY